MVYAQGSMSGHGPRTFGSRSIYFGLGSASFKELDTPEVILMNSISSFG
jgi:hypothetical protein